MAQLPSTRWKVIEVLSAVRELGKELNNDVLSGAQAKLLYKNALSEVATLLNAASDPSYFVSTVLTLAADCEFLKSTAGGTITTVAVVSSTISITRTSGLFVVGQMLHMERHDTGTGALTHQCIARVTSGGGIGTATILAGSMADSGVGYGFSITAVKSYSTATADISTINYDRIVTIHDSTAGECIYLSPKDYFSLTKTAMVHTSYTDDIVWTQIGNILHFKTGSNTSSGTKTMYYLRQPEYPTTWDTDYMDLSDKWVSLLIKKIYTYLIMQVENDTPKNISQEMQMDIALITGAIGAEKETKKDKN